MNKNTLIGSALLIPTLLSGCSTTIDTKEQQNIPTPAGFEQAEYVGNTVADKTYLKTNYANCEIDHYANPQRTQLVKNETPKQYFKNKIEKMDEGMNGDDDAYLTTLADVGANIRSNVPKGLEFVMESPICKTENLPTLDEINEYSMLMGSFFVPAYCKTQPDLGRDEFSKSVRDGGVDRCMLNYTHNLFNAVQGLPDAPGLFLPEYGVLRAVTQALVGLGTDGTHMTYDNERLEEFKYLASQFNGPWSNMPISEKIEKTKRLFTRPVIVEAAKWNTQH